MLTKETLARTLALTALPLALLPAGCGGGSNSTGNNSPVVQTLTLTGTVSSLASGAAVGDTVVFDGNNALSAVTNGQGQFTLTLPASNVTGNDTLTVSNSQGVVLETVPVTSTTTPVTITLPPGPPSGLGGL